MSTHNAKQNVKEQPAGKVVSVTYQLKKSAFVSFLENGFSIGYVNIDLLSDQEMDSNSFSSAEGKSYACFLEDGALRLTVFAEGKAGDFWSLELQIDGRPAASNPIRVETDQRGHLDIDQLIN
jgi:hypothetical protein